jgi:hypothetical protein
MVVTGAFLASQAAAARQRPPTISALATLPPPGRPLPAGLQTAIARQASMIRLGRRQAQRRTRLLRSNVTGLPVYGFGGAGGSVCFIVWRGVGTCGRITSPTYVLWAVNGGSRKRGQAVVGIVSDPVVRVRVRIDNTWHIAAPVHNVFYVAYRKPTTPRIVVIAVTH